MAYAADVYPSGARDHVMEMNDEILAELEGRKCPRCGYHESRPIESDSNGEKMAGLPLRACIACDEVFGFDDSFVPDRLLPRVEKPSGGGIWDSGHGNPEVYPRPSSPCFRDAEAGAAGVDWSDDEVEDRDHDQHHSKFTDPPRDGTRGRGRRGRGRGHHHGDDHCQHHHHHHHCSRGRGQRGRCGNDGSLGGGQASSNGGDPWKQVTSTCLQSGCRCAMDVANDLIAGRIDGAVATVSDEMEPLGRAFGSAVGTVTGDLIGSPRAGEICADMGSTVGRGMAEMLKDSSLCSRRSTSQD